MGTHQLQTSGKLQINSYDYEHHTVEHVEMQWGKGILFNLKFIAYKQEVCRSKMNAALFIYSKYVTYFNIIVADSIHTVLVKQ